MAIQDTDLFIVNSGASSYKVPASELSDASGVVLVNRGSASYKCDVANVSDKVLDTDLLLVNRGSASYKVLGSEVKTLFGPTEILLDDQLNWTMLIDNFVTIPNVGQFYYPAALPTGILNVSTSSGYTVKVDSSNVSTQTGLIATFKSAFNKYKITKVVYGPYAKQQGGSNPNNQSSFDKISTQHQSLNGSTASRDTSVSQKEPSETQIYDTGSYLSIESDAFISELRLDGYNPPSAKGNLIVSFLNVYGYEVNPSTGEPI